MTDPNGNGLLKMRELAAASGVSPGTVKHYLREGLLPEPVRTSRNMAYYPPDYVERIQLIKRLQEDRFMPLRITSSCMISTSASRSMNSRTGSPKPRALGSLSPARV